MEYEFFISDLYGMARIGSALKPDDDIRVQSEKINDFGFSFVPPLGTDYYTIWHKSFSKKNTNRGKPDFPAPFFAHKIEKKSQRI